MQLALIIPISGEQLPPGLLPSPQPPWVPGAPGTPGAGQLPSHPAPPSREEIKAALKAKLEEWAAGFNPPTREEVKAKLEQIAAALRDKLAETLPDYCMRPEPK